MAVKDVGSAPEVWTISAIDERWLSGSFNLIHVCDRLSVTGRRVLVREMRLVLVENPS
jgi:hypothetical protein